MLIETCGSPNASTLDLDFLPNPVNDDFEHRALIPGYGGTATVDTTFATFESGEPSDLPPGFVGYGASFQTVWWTWTAPVAGQVKIQPSNRFAYLLGLYSGVTLSNLTPVTRIFNGGVVFDVAAGTNLQISVDGISPQSGVLTLNLEFTPTPRNDDFKNSKIAIGIKTTLNGNNTAATREPGEPLHDAMASGRSVWWKWVAPVSGYVTLRPATNSAALVVAIYTGTSVSNLTALAASAQGGAGFDAIEGATYQIAVDGFAGWQGSFSLDLLLSTIHLTEPSPGALFYVGDPIVLAARTTRLDGNGREVEFFADTQFLGSAFRPHPSIAWTNAGLGAYRLTAGTTDHRGDVSRSGPVDIRVRPPNDDFTNSLIIEGLDVVTNGTNLGAGREAGEPSGGDASADASVWYSWVAHVSGEVVVNIQESSFWGHPYGVYVGNSVSNLVALGESIDEFLPIGFIAHAGMTYHIEISGVGHNVPDGAGPFTLNLHQTPAPPNDDFANAINLSGTVATAVGSNFGATREPGEPDHSIYGIDNSVWWTWTAPAKGQITLDFQGSDITPIVSLYTGSTVSNIALIGRAYTGYGLGPPIAHFNVEAGNLYHIALVGAIYPGHIVMDLSFALAPPNDNFASRLQMSGLFVTVSGSNNTATAEEGEPISISDGRTVWWSWTAPVAGPVSLATIGSTFLPWLSVFTGGTVTNLITVTNGLSRLAFDALAGTQYQIAADGLGGHIGQIELTLIAGLPQNDAFSSRLSLSGTNVTMIASTLGATREPLEPAHAGYSGSNSIWWTWTTPATGTVTINVTGDGFNPIWAVYTGSTLGALSYVGDSVHSSVHIPVEPGIPLQIAVDGAVEVGERTAGIVTMSLSFVGLPPNDNFSDRIPITGTSFHLTGNTSGATREPGEPNHAGYRGGRSIWWSWTAPASGHVTLDAFGSAVYTLAAVYTGDTITNLTNVASGNATYGPLDFDCGAGVTYQIALDHWYPDLFGAVNLNFTFSSIRLISPTNDAVFHEPPQIALTATNTVWDGTFEQMEFLANGNTLGTVSTGPYALIWTNPPLGNYSVQARVTDSYGVTRRSPAIMIHNRPANDDFASRIPILENTAAVHASGINASLEFGEPVHGWLDFESVWWSWTAPADGQLSLSRAPDWNFRYVLIDVYTGFALTNLALVTNTTENGSGTIAESITFDAQQGTTYQIAVAGSFFNIGDVPVTLSFTPGLTNVPVSQSTARPGAVIAVLSQPERVSPSQFSFILSAPPGLSYIIQASTNISLIQPIWFTIMTTNLSGDQAIIEDKNADDQQRFYRVKIGP